jgi:cytoskeletal protein CcmA (bactofilin family)
MKGNTTEINGDYSGSIYPTKQAEIMEEINLTSSFKVKGGVFSKNIKFNGKGSISGSVYASNEISIVPPDKNELAYKLSSGLFAGSTISVLDSNHIATMPTDLDKNMMIVKGDVVSDIVQLERTTVIGNIRARKVFLKDCSVIGGVYADEELVLDSCRLIFFTSGNCSIKNQNFFWMPYGISSNLFNFVDDNAKIIFTGFGDLNPIDLGKDDIHISENEEGDTIYSISLARRAWDLSSLESNFKRIEAFLKSFLIFEHLDEESKSIALENWPKTMREEDANFFLKIFNGKPSSPAPKKTKIKKEE